MKRKPTPMEKLTRSHMRLLKVQRGLITEVGLLRKLLLEMRDSFDYDHYRGFRDTFLRSKMQ